jgi:adenylyltransferase/sulfurtransferase
MVGGLDSREARLFVNRLAWRTGRPWVDGAMEALAGVARVFRPPDSCYECTLTATDFEILSHRQSCRMLSNDDLVDGKVPTTATTSSVVAGLQVQEVVKLLHADRDGVQGVDGGFVLDGANNDSYVIRYPFGINCQAHDTYVDPITLDTDETTTFRDVVSAAGWDEALVELGDDHLVGWRCTSCGLEASDHGPVMLKTFRDAECPDCGEPRQPESVTTVAVPGKDADTPLGEFGIRVDEILAVRQGLDHRYVWAKQLDPELPDGWR